MKQKEIKSKKKISRVEVTTDTMTGRGGISLFVKYLSGIKIYEILVEHFMGIRKSRKGVSIWNIFKQIMCNFYDGTSRHLTCFDEIKRDEGYRAAIELKQS